MNSYANTRYTNAYTYTRHAGLWSTAEGYDIHILFKGEHREDCFERVYRNVHAATMRRFYNLSKNYIDAHKSKTVGWRQYRRLFKVESW